MSIEKIISAIQSKPDSVEFNDVIDVIEANYDYSPAAFKNGETENTAGSNEGSCKIFAFALINQLSEQQTLACFGKYYRDDVLGNPGGDDHANIRNFMQHGWKGIAFESTALVSKGISGKAG